MRRLLASCFVVGVICTAAWTAKLQMTFAAGDTGDAAVMHADKALQLALKNKNPKAVGALLDQEFSWTNDAGHTRKSAQFLRDAAAGKADATSEYTDVKSRDYGQLAVVTGTGIRSGRAAVFFAR